MKKVLVTIIVVTLILLGVYCIVAPKMAVKKLEQNMEDVQMQTEQLSKENIEDNINSKLGKEDYDFSIVRYIDPSMTFASDSSKVDKKRIIGQLVIPSLDLNLTIFKGVNNNHLLTGACTMKPDDVMGEGNFCLAGHFCKNPKVLFGGLMQLKKGDVIKITDKTNIYEYEVYAHKVVPYKDLAMISNDRKGESGQPIISLMTCYYSSKTGKRYFVLGNLVDKYPYTRDKMEQVVKKLPKEDKPETEESNK